MARSPEPARAWRAGWTVLALAYMGGLFALSSIPDDTQDVLGRRMMLLEPRWHNLLHIPAYAGLTFLLVRAMSAWSSTTRRHLVIAVIVASVYGALDEVHQYYVPGRFFSLIDMTLNAAGAVLLATCHNYAKPRSTTETH